MKSTFCVLFYLKNQPNKQGLCPVIVRITIDHLAVSFNTKQNIRFESWNQASGRVKGTSPQSKLINHTLATIRAQLITKYNEIHIIRQEPISAARLRDLYLGIDKVPTTLLAYFDRFNDRQQKLLNKSIAYSTFKKYILTRARLAYMLKQSCADEREHGRQVQLPQESTLPIRQGEVPPRLLEVYVPGYRREVPAGIHRLRTAARSSQRKQRRNPGKAQSLSGRLCQGQRRGHLWREPLHIRSIQAAGQVEVYHTQSPAARHHSTHRTGRSCHPQTTGEDLSRSVSILVLRLRNVAHRCLLPGTRPDQGRHDHLRTDQARPGGSGSADRQSGRDHRALPDGELYELCLSGVQVEEDGSGAYVRHGQPRELQGQPHPAEDLRPPRHPLEGLLELRPQQFYLEDD